MRGQNGNLGERMEFARQLVYITEMSHKNSLGGGAGRVGYAFCLPLAGTSGCDLYFLSDNAVVSARTFTQAVRDQCYIFIPLRLRGGHRPVDRVLTGICHQLVCSKM